ncbi:MAG: hydroxymethylbilane synthase [Anaerolineae bacterium]
MRTIRLGTRGSALARWQAAHVVELLRQVWADLQVEVIIMTTKGDITLDTPLPQLGGKGVFTAELEAALRSGELDCAVHSLKDLPTTQPAGLTIGAVPLRGSVQDVLVSREGYTLDTLPQGAVIGTGSPRRAAQVLYHRPDLRVQHIRGNVDTRIGKALAADGPYTAIILARAGLERLSKLDAASQTLPLEHMLPAPGQGALAVQCRSEEASLRWFTAINHPETQASVTAERAFLAGLGGGCTLPAAAYAHVEDGKLSVQGRLCSADGRQRIDGTLSTDDLSVAAAAEIGHTLARQALAQGGAEWIANQ